jgi:hypothetical protein
MGPVNARDSGLEAGNCDEVGGESPVQASRSIHGTRELENAGIQIVDALAKQRPRRRKYHYLNPV